MRRSSMWFPGFWVMQVVLQATEEGRERNLATKIHTNLGITLEAQGLLLGACQSYRSRFSPLPCTAISPPLLLCRPARASRYSVESASCRDIQTPHIILRNPWQPPRMPTVSLTYWIMKLLLPCQSGSQRYPTTHANPAAMPHRSHLYE